jgi:lipid-binding SYLF domain-containing protein
MQLERTDSDPLRNLSSGKEAQQHSYFTTLRSDLMNFKTIAFALVIAILSARVCGAGDSDDEKRQKTRKMSADVLTNLYKTEPASKAAIQKAAGHAVFNNMGVNVLLLSTARGSGLAVNNKTKEETFMKMVSAGGGLGMGVKDYDVVFFFETEKAFAEFLDSGWSGSGQADAAAKAGDKGGAYSGAMEVAPEFGSTRSPRMASPCS